MNMQKIICISGPTASGKTALSIALARKIGSEIISCDSMQIYKGMDIGTAKPTAEEQSLARHHMIDVCMPSESYSCADYKRDADRCIADISGRGMIPIFCGGTGLYLESVIYQSDFTAPAASEEVRERLLLNTPEENYKMLLEVDREAAESMHMNNVKRVIRALEIYICSGITKTEHDRLSRKEKNYDAKIYVLTSSDRELLYDRINKRVDMMMEQGLLDEVRALDEKCLSTAMQAIGYKELYAYLNGSCTLREAVEDIKKASRNYAKRQITWWGRSKDAVFLDVAKMSKEEMLEYVIADISK